MAIGSRRKLQPKEAKICPKMVLLATSKVLVLPEYGKYMLHSRNKLWILSEAVGVELHGARYLAWTCVKDLFRDYVYRESLAMRSMAPTWFDGSYLSDQNTRLWDL